ncbi:MAG TPA: FHA domain-containing protein [Bdellovibrionales bacterium]|nr:FHA domain-containing protein [Bdellovibrionales bacterium]
MWSLRILNGPLAGRTFQLKEGENLVGRSPECHISLASNGISKKHAKIIVSGKNLSVVDLQSSNGTFVNGVRIQTRILNPVQDKIAFYDVLVSVDSMQSLGPAPVMGSGSAQPLWQSSPASQPQSMPQAQPERNPVNMVSTYVEEVAMPGVYRLLELFEFKQVLGGFLLSFVFLVTLLSVFPLMRITKASIEKESQFRARGIARTLAVTNRGALQQGLESSLNTQIADYEPGVRVALIISAKDGSIIAPASKAAGYANEPFIHRARKQQVEVVEQIDDSLIGASVPIMAFNSETGTQGVLAYAMVLYNMGSLAIDDSRTISLFIQTLFIALILGSILFYFLYKLVEHPISSINKQLDLALKEEGKSVQTAYLIPTLEKLVFNINTALNRVSFGAPKEPPRNTTENKKAELINIAQISSNPCMVLDKDRLISFVNAPLEDLIGMRLASVQEQALDILIDEALRQSIVDLADRAMAQPSLIASNELDLAGKNYDIDAQAVMGPQAVDFYFISFRRKGDDAL